MPDLSITIGALSRASGVPVETIRTWEARYGFPRAKRKPSGHRLYPIAAVERLRRVSRAIASGIRAAEAVPASDQELDTLLAIDTRSPPPFLPAPEPIDTGAILALVVAFDGDRLTRTLLADAARLGPLGFVESRAQPLVRAVGEAWAKGGLEIRHEHFLSERLGDVFRTLRLGWDERATGTLVALATLPGESHTLGLQMAALVLAAAGCRVAYFGAEIPLPELPRLMVETRARALGISASASAAGARTTASLARLVARLPRGVTLLVGGEGAPASLTGAVLIRDLRALDTWARSV